MAITVEKVDDLLEIKIEGRWSEIAEAKDKVKDIPGRRWNPEKKVWVVPAEPHIADRLLKTIKPECSDELMAWLKASMTSAEESLTTSIPSDSTDLLIPWATQRMPWQPEVVNDVKFAGALDYQRAAIDVMASNGRALLCDDMGLGKTFEAISAVEEYVLRSDPNGDFTAEGPRLAIAPASVLGGWARELNRWLDDPPVVVVDGSSPKTRNAQLIEGITNNAWVIVNWEQLRIKKVKVKTQRGGKKTLYLMKQPLFEYPQAAEWGLTPDDWEDVANHAKAARAFGKEDPYWLAAMADEIHRAKNKDAAQTKGLHRVQASMMLGLTGTPIMNSPDELWSLLRWLWPDEFHERGAAHAPGALAYWPFYMTYVDFWEDHFGRKVVTGVKNPDALRYLLKGKLIRRTANILGLKGRRRFFYDVPLNPDQQKLYNEAEKSMWLAVEADVAAGNKDAIEFARKAAEGGTIVELMQIPNGAARFVRLQQIIENAALLGGPDSSANMDDFEQKFADSRPNPWVVFCLYKDSCSILAERLRRKYGAEVRVYNGDVSPRDRTEIEDEFQRGEVDVIVGTIDAMYQGITLTRGHLQHWLSRAVVPAKNEQGESRSDRQGQQDLVRVYIPQAANTVSTDKVHVINRLKEGIVRTVVPQDKIEEGTTP